MDLIELKKRKIRKQINLVFWLFILFLGLFGLSLLTHRVFAGSQQTSSTLASAIITNARMYLNDTTATYFHTDAEMLAYLNSGTIDIVARTHCLEAIEEKTLQVGTTNYPITGSFITVKNVIYKSFDEKVTNGTMEADSSWADTASAPATNERSTTQVYYGTYSRKFTPDLEDEGIQSAVFTTVTGTTYYYSLFVYPDDETSVNVYVYKGDGLAAIVDSDVTGLTENGWNVISGSYTETVGGAGAYISIRSPTGIAAGDWYVDDVSIYTSGASKPLRRGSIEHMADMSTDMVEPSYWTCWGNDVIVYPAPDSTTAGNIIDVYTVSRPVAVETELIGTVADRDFSVASNWTNVDINAYNEATDLTITANAVGQYCVLPVANAPMISNQAYVLEFDVANIVSTWTISDFDAGYTIGTITANGANQQIVFSYTDASSGGLRITSVANDSSADLDNFSLIATTVLVPAYFDRALTLYIVAQALKKDAKYAQSNAVLAEYQAELDRYRADFSYQPVKEQID